MDSFHTEEMFSCVRSSLSAFLILIFSYSNFLLENVLLVFLLLQRNPSSLITISI